MAGNSVSHGRTPAVPEFNLSRPAGHRTDAALARALSADNSGHDVGPKQGPQAGNCIESWRYSEGRVLDATGASAPGANAVRRMMYWCKDSCRVVIQKGDPDVRG
jgi:hypothetical protein